MAIHIRTRSEIRHEVARLTEGDGFLLGTVTGGDATTAPAAGTFSCNLVGWSHDTNYFNEWKEVFCYAGNAGSIGESGNPTDWEATTWQLTFSPAYTWVASDSVEMHQVFNVVEIDNAINRALDSVAKEALELKVAENIVLDTVLTNGMFESGAGLDNWTDSPNAPTTSERSSTFVMEGSYSAKIVSDGTNANWIYQNVTDYAKHLGKSYLLKCKVHTTTASRVRLSLDDGVTQVYSSYHLGKAVEELSISGTLSNEATGCQVQLRVEAGTAVTVYFDACYLTFGHIYEYDISTEFMFIHRLEIESTTRDRYDFVLPWDYWRILPESTPRIWFNPDKWAPTSGRKLRIHGMASPARLTADTQQCSINPTFLAYKAAADLMLSRSKEKGDEFFTKGQALAMQAAIERQQIFFDLPMGSRAVLAG